MTLNNKDINTINGEQLTWHTMKFKLPELPETSPFELIPTNSNWYHVTFPYKTLIEGINWFTPLKI